MAVMGQIRGGNIGEIGDYTIVKTWNGTASSSINFTAEVGKKYLVLLFGTSATTINYKTYDGATCSGGTMTAFTTNLTIANNYGVGTFYQITATSTSVTITSAVAAAYHIFGIS